VGGTFALLCPGLKSGGTRHPVPAWIRHWVAGKGAGGESVLVLAIICVTTVWQTIESRYDILLYSLGRELHSLTAAPRPSWPSTLLETAIWVSAIGLSNNNKWRSWTWITDSDSLSRLVGFDDRWRHYRRFERYSRVLALNVSSSDSPTHRYTDTQTHTDTVTHTPTHRARLRTTITWLLPDSRGQLGDKCTDMPVYIDDPGFAGSYNRAQFWRHFPTFYNLYEPSKNWTIKLNCAVTLGGAYEETTRHWVRIKLTGRMQPFRMVTLLLVLLSQRAYNGNNLQGKKRPVFMLSAITPPKVNRFG